MPPKIRGKPSKDKADTLRARLLGTVDKHTIVQRSNASGGERYEGQVLPDGRRHGKGLLLWPNGNVYAGDWVEGAMCGSGEFVYAVEGDHYIGGFADDKKDGRGVYTFANGNSYDGCFARDKRHGRGRYRWMCGDEYDGEWFEGRMHGHGVTAYANGNRYSGAFVEDRREGFGKLVCTDGLSYEGEWEANNRHGSGRLDFPSGDFYDGQWFNDKKHGQGKDHFANGNVFEGEYHANAKHGKGVMRYSNGDSYSGGWASDRMEGHGVYTFANGFVYDGEWHADARHGHGEYRFPNGHVYVGEWANDRRHGRGCLTLSSNAPDNAGETYEGTWVDGKMSGVFVVRNGAGHLCYEGRWSDGSPNGGGTFWTAALSVEGSVVPEPAVKRSLGTIDQLPQVVELIATCLSSATGSTHFGVAPPAAVPSVGEIREATAVAHDFEAPLGAWTTVRKQSSTSAMQTVRSAQVRREALEQTRTTVLALQSQGTQTLNPERIEALHQSITERTEHSAAGEEAFAESEDAVTRAAALNASLKEQIKKRKLTKQTADAKKKESAQLERRTEVLQESIGAVESEAANAERDAEALRRESLTCLETAVAQCDSEIAVKRAATQELESQVTATQRGMKERETVHRQKLHSLKTLTDELREHCDTVERTGRALDDERCRIVAQLETRSRESCANAARRDGVVASLAGEIEGITDECATLTNSIIDIENETAVIQRECESKSELIAQASALSSRTEIEASLYRERSVACVKAAEEARNGADQARHAAAGVKAAIMQDKVRGELRRKLDRELMAAERRAVDAERIASELESDLNVICARSTSHSCGLPRGSAIDRLKTIREERERETNKPEVTERVQALREQLRAAQRRLGKKHERVAHQQEEARRLCEPWLNAGETTTTSALAAAAKESHIHQIMKLRANFERVSREKTRLLSRGADRASEDARELSDSDTDGDDDDRFVAQVLRHLAASDRDWRMNYLVEQLEARKRQIAELSEQAQYAKDLERKVVAANAAMSGYSHPKSASGSKPPSDTMMTRRRTAL